MLYSCLNLDKLKDQRWKANNPSQTELLYMLRPRVRSPECGSKIGTGPWISSLKNEEAASEERAVDYPFVWRNPCQSQLLHCFKATNRQ